MMNLRAERIPESIVLPMATVERILDIYVPEHVYISEATINGKSLNCSLKPTLYPYTTQQIFDYITAPTATLFACQLTYVLIGGMVIGKHTLAAPIGSWETFLEIRNRALLRVAQIELRFDSEVSNRGPIQGHIRVDRAIQLHRRTHCRMAFKIGDGISGKIHGVLIGE